MGIVRRIWALGKRSKLDREIEDELRDHLQMRTNANIAKGMSPDQAARAARLRFGNPEVVKEHSRQRTQLLVSKVCCAMCVTPCADSPAALASRP